MPSSMVMATELPSDAGGCLDWTIFPTMVIVSLVVTWSPCREKTSLGELALASARESMATVTANIKGLEGETRFAGEELSDEVEGELSRWLF